MNRPELLLADEPTGNLDSRTGEEVLQYLFQLATESCLTLVLVTHNEGLAERCSRRLYLRDGQIVESGGLGGGGGCRERLSFGFCRRKPTAVFPPCRFEAGHGRT